MPHKVATIEELEALYPASQSLAPASRDKETALINDAYRQLIEACPFAVVASRGAEGMDCSPRGDGPGFLHILDENRIALPDRRGNNRLDTLRNIVETGDIALLLLIPGMNETFRINGKAIISTDPELLDSMSQNGKVPVSAIIVTIETMYFQCARALVRSKLWDDSTRIDPKTLPSAGDLLRSVISDFDGESYDAALPGRQAKTLY